MSTGEIIGIAFWAGYTVSWLLNRKPAVINNPVIRGAKITANLVIDQKLLDQIEAEQVDAWLKSRGLVWQPKGAVFDPSKDVKK